MQIRRVNRSKNQARVAYDRLSVIYDMLASGSEAPLISLGLGMLSIDPDDLILEIGPGTGEALLKLAGTAGYSGNVHGIDLSAGMLKKAHARVIKAGLTKKVNLVVGDGVKLPYQSSTFNTVFMGFTLELFDTPEIPQVLAESCRVLAPGGQLGVVSLLKPNRPNLIVRLYEWFHDAYPTLADCRPIIASSLIQTAGFAILSRLEKKMWGLPVEMVVGKKI